MYARQQAALAELTKSILAETDLPTLMQQAITLVVDTLAVAYGAIWAYLPEERMLVLRADAGWDASLAGTFIEARPTSLVGCTVLGTTPALVSDWLNEQRFSQPSLWRERGIRSSLALAIPGQEQPFGSLSVDGLVARHFSDAEIHFLEAVASILAILQVHQTIAQRVEARTRTLNEQWLAASHAQVVLEERQRLARDLHDSVTQALYAITLHSQAARRLLTAGDTAAVSDSLRALQDTAQEALDEMRLLIFELRPPILEQVGLEMALQVRLNAVEGRAHLQTKLIADGIGDLPAAIEQALYRIAQEALNNVLKHARARHVTVHLWQLPGSVCLEIADDGIGFAHDAAQTAGGLGLHGIAERVAQLHGRFVLQSVPGSGTLLRVEIAL